MKFGQSMKATFLIVAAFSSFSIFAADSSSTPAMADFMSRIQRPEIPAGTSMASLPQSNKVGKNFGTKCYAAYLIEKIGHREDHRGGRRDNDRRDREVSYKIAVTNLGECPLTDLVIKDFFPEDTRLIDAHPWPRFVGHHQAVWTLDWLDVGRRVVFDVEFKLDRRDHDRSQRSDRDDDRWITNTACVWSEMIGEKACAWASVRSERDHDRRQPS